MMFRSLTLLAALSISLPVFAQDVYKIDAVHSQIGFRIRHLVAKTSGRFTRFEGLVKVDPKDISRSSVEIQIDAASINTDNEARDKHLRSADFFEVAKFPVITFRSTSVKEVEKGKLRVTGVLVMHGVTRTISFPITNAGTRPGMQPGSVAAGFIDGALKLNRNDFGIKTYPGVLGDDVDISLDIEAGK